MNVDIAGDIIVIRPWQVAHHDIESVFGIATKLVGNSRDGRDEVVLENGSALE